MVGETDGLWPSARWVEALLDPDSALEVIVQRVGGVDEDGNTESLKDICRSRLWPYSLVARWIAEDDKRREKYEFALKLKADVLAQEAVGIADTVKRGVIRKTDPDGGVTETEEDMLAHRKLQIDTRLKLAARWDRARYGEHVDVRHSGAVGGGLTIVLAALSVEDARRVVSPERGGGDETAGRVLEHVPAAAEETPPALEREAVLAASAQTPLRAVGADDGLI